MRNHRDVIVSLLPNHHKPLFEKWGRLLCVIIRVVSSKGTVNALRYRTICTELYVLMLKELPWISITPTIHKLLGHTWELILENEGKGLGSLDESGLEACNKVLRRFRTTLSRKRSQADNLTDVLSRLWVNSDPILNVERQKALPFCRECNMKGHSTRYCTAKKESSDDLLLLYLTS